MGRQTLSEWAVGEPRFTTARFTGDGAAKAGSILPRLKPQVLLSNAHPSVRPHCLTRKTLPWGVGGWGSVPQPALHNGACRPKRAHLHHILFVFFFPPSCILKIAKEAFQCHLVGEGRASLFVPGCYNGICWKDNKAGVCLLVSLMPG